MLVYLFGCFASFVCCFCRVGGMGLICVADFCWILSRGGCVLGFVCFCLFMALFHFFIYLFGDFVIYLLFCSFSKY